MLHGLLYSVIGVSITGLFGIGGGPVIVPALF
jgi:uncharacterized membrane protein YfcA